MVCNDFSDVMEVITDLIQAMVNSWKKNKQQRRRNKLVLPTSMDEALRRAQFEYHRNPHE